MAWCLAGTPGGSCSHRGNGQVTETEVIAMARAWAGHNLTTGRLLAILGRMAR